MVLAGTAPGFQAAKRFSSFGTRSASVVSPTTTAKLDGSLDLYADVLLNPTFPESEFKREQAIQLANIQQEQSEPFGMALRVFPPLLFGEGHAYSMPYSGSGKADTVSKLSRLDLEKLYATWVRPNNSVLVRAES